MVLLHLCENIGLIRTYFQDLVDLLHFEQATAYLWKYWGIQPKVHYNNQVLTFSASQIERYFVTYINETGKCCYELETLEKWPSNANDMLANITQREHVQGNNIEPIMWQLVPIHEYHHNSQTHQEKRSVASNDLKYEIIHDR